MVGKAIQVCVLAGQIYFTLHWYCIFRKQITQGYIRKVFLLTFGSYINFIDVCPPLISCAIYFDTLFYVYM